MSTTNNILSKPNKKHVLQQSNFNLEVAKNKEDHKLLERNVFQKNKKEILETENHSPQKRLEKLGKSDAKKLRSIRLDLSSLKRSFTQKSKSDLTSDESSEDEGKKKKKSRPIVPNYVTNSDNGPCRKPRQNRQDPLVLSSQNSPKLVKSQPLSIARRNARERNRVKQVNEGFATLRSRIPEYIAEAYNEEKGRKSAKKLSKVETLRMAVDYIRHLETLLEIKSTDKEWMQDSKTEIHPWETPNSSVGYSSPVESKYQLSCAESPATSYDQGFEYQDRIFYEYDLDFITRKGILNAEKRSTEFGSVAYIRNDGDSVDDFRYYETFNRLKKDGNGDGDGCGSVKEDQRSAEGADAEEVSENSDTESATGRLLSEANHLGEGETTKNTVLPSITETFSKGIPVFF